jgi:hypothetical protein
LQDKAALGQLLKNLARGLAQHHKVPGWGERMKAWLLYRVLGAIVGRIANVEVKQKEELSDDAKATLKMYLQGPLRAQVLSERSDVPAEVTLVFGHTHKPFERVASYQGFAEDVRVLNSGGWVVDDMHATAPAGWAVILLDEDLNAASLRFPNHDGATPNTICVAQAAGAQAAGSTAAPNPLHERLVGLVDSTKAPWSNFVAALQLSVAEHLANLRLKISGAS